MAEYYSTDFNEILEEERQKLEETKTARKSAVVSMYYGRISELNEQYDKAIDDTNADYSWLKDRNTVQRLITERQIKETLTKMNAKNSDLNRTQRTATQISHTNRNSDIDRARRNVVDRLSMDLATSVSWVEQNKENTLDELEAFSEQEVQNNAIIHYNANLQENKRIYEEELRKYEESIKAAEANIAASKYVVTSSTGTLNRGYEGSLKSKGVDTVYNYNADGTLKSVTYNDNNSGISATFAAGVNPYCGYMHEDAKDKNGVYDPSKVYSNGYQPNNIGGKKLVLEEKKGFSINGNTQNVFKCGDKYYVWDGAYNEYFEVKRFVDAGVPYWVPTSTEKKRNFVSNVTSVETARLQLKQKIAKDKKMESVMVAPNASYTGSHKPALLYGNPIALGSGYLDDFAKLNGFYNYKEKQEYKENNPELYEAMGGVKYIPPNEIGASKEAVILSNAAVNEVVKRFSNTDISEIQNIIDTLNSGEWQNADTMEKYNDTVSAYVNDYIALDSLGCFDSAPEADRKTYIDSFRQIKTAVNETKNIFADYEDADSYKKAVKENEEYQKLISTDIVALQNEIDALEGYYAKAKKLYDKVKIYTRQKSNWEHRSNGLKTDGGYDVKLEAAKKELNVFLSSLGYTTFDELETDLKEKKDYKEEAVEAQETAQEKIHFHEIAISGEGRLGYEKWIEDKRIAEEQKAKQENEKAVPDWLTTAIEAMGNYNAAQSGYTNIGNVVTATINFKMADNSYQEPQSNWTDEEKYEFGARYLEDPEKAYDYAANLNNIKNTAKENERKKNIEKAATSNFWSGAAHTIGALVTAPTAIGDFFDDYTDLAAGRRVIVEEGDVTPFEYSQTVISGISSHLNDKGGTLNEKIPIIGGKGWGDVYSLGTSILQSGASAATLGPVGTAISYFGQGAASAVDDAVARGATIDEALAYGTIVGAAEAVSEYIGADKLMSLTSKSIIKSAFRLALEQAGAEGLEETFSALIDNIADNIIMGEKSKFNLLVEKYQSEDMSRDEAVNKAWTETVEDIAYNGLSGWVSGGLHAGSFLTINAVRNNNMGKIIFGSSPTSINAIVENGLAMPEGSNAFNQAAKAQSRLDGGKKLSGTALYNLATAIEGEIQTKSEARLSELGENKGNIKEVSAAVAKKVFSGRLTSAEAALISNSKYGNQVVEELSADNANTIWKDTIKSSNGNNLNSITYVNGAQGVGANADGGVSKVADGEQVKAVPVSQTSEKHNLLYDTRRASIEGYKRISVKNTAKALENSVESGIMNTVQIGSIFDESHYNPEDIQRARVPDYRRISAVDKTNKNAIIKERGFAQRNLAMGLRKPRTHILSENEIQQIKEDINAIGADEKIFRFNSGFQTSYVDEFDIINIRGDVLPDKNSNNPRDLMSSRAVIAHEYYGHRAFRGTKLPKGSWNDEFRASYMAAKNTPNLTDEDRKYLILDALERAKEKGISIKYNKIIRRILYGY